MGRTYVNPFCNLFSFSVGIRWNLSENEFLMRFTHSWENHWVEFVDSLGVWGLCIVFDLGVVHISAFQTNWLTRKRNTSQLPMNWIKHSANSLATKTDFFFWLLNILPTKPSWAFIITNWCKNLFILELTLSLDPSLNFLTVTHFELRLRVTVKTGSNLSLSLQCESSVIFIIWLAKLFFFSYYYYYFRYLNYLSNYSLPLVIWLKKKSIYISFYFHLCWMLMLRAYVANRYFEVLRF